MVIDMTNGFHFRPESLGFLLAWNDPEETIGYKTDFEPSFIEKILVRAADRVPCFENVAVNPKRAWAGLYEMSPDHHCILGPVEDVPGFFCANGFSGHGVMHAPSTGRILADLIRAWQDGRSQQRRGAQPCPLRQRRTAARDGGAVTGQCPSPSMSLGMRWQFLRLTLSPGGAKDHSLAFQGLESSRLNPSPGSGGGSPCDWCSG